MRVSVSDNTKFLGGPKNLIVKTRLKQYLVKTLILHQLKNHSWRLEVQSDQKQCDQQGPRQCPTKNQERGGIPI